MEEEEEAGGLEVALGTMYAALGPTAACSGATAISDVTEGSGRYVDMIHSLFVRAGGMRTNA